MNLNLFSYVEVLSRKRQYFSLTECILSIPTISFPFRSACLKMADEVFKKVNEEDIPKVLNVLKEDWPKHFLLHQILTVLDEYKRAGTKWKHSLYLYGDYKTGVYLNQLYVEFKNGGMIYFNIYTANTDLEPLSKALQQTKLIPWKAVKPSVCDVKFGFLMTPHSYQNAIKEAFAKNDTKYEIEEDNMFWYPPKKDLQPLLIPEDVYLDFLDGSFAEEMNKSWSHRFPGSDLVHKEHLEKNFGLGLFRRADKKLVSSALSNYTGGIFVLYSDPEFRGRGFAKIIVQHMVKELRRRGRIPFGTIILGNTASEKVFSKSGFEAFSTADYIFPK